MRDPKVLREAVHRIAEEVSNGWLGTEDEKRYQVKVAALVAYCLALKGVTQVAFEHRLDETVGDSDRISTLFSEVFPISPSCCNENGECKSDGKDNRDCVCFD